MVIEDRSQPGTCDVIAQIRVKGDQDILVRVAGPVSGIRTSEIAITFGKTLIYLQDQRALDELTIAVRRAWDLAPRVFPQATRLRRS